MSASNPAFIWLIVSVIGIVAFNLINFESMGLSKTAISLVRLIALVFALNLFGMVFFIL
jgi:hypothetical protein